MPSGFITATVHTIMDFFFGGSDISPPATLYASCITTAPAADGSGIVESTVTNGRVAITNNSTNFPAASSRAKSNGTVIDFGTATGSATIVGVAFYTGSSGGTPISYGDLPADMPVVSGNPVSIPIGSFDFTMAYA